MPEKISVIKNPEKKSKGKAVKGSVTEQASNLTETKRARLEVLKKTAKDLEKSGRGESEVLNTLEPEIYALERDLAGGEAVALGKEEKGEMVTPEIAEKGMENGKTDSKLDSVEAPTVQESAPAVMSIEDKIAKLDAHIKSISSGKSTEELQKIVEAGLSSSKDQKEIARELDAQEIKSLRESILKAKEEAVRLNQDATLDWYEGNYDKAKAGQDKARLIEDALGIKSNVEIQKAEKAPASTEMTATESMSLKHGKEKVAKAQMMYLLEKDRLKNLGRTGKRFEEELNMYKKKYIYPMFEVAATQPVQKIEKPMSDVERYGQETLNEVSKIRTEEMKRLVNLGLSKEIILKRMEDFEKVRINPILKSQDKMKPVESHESVTDMSKKKDQEKKKGSFWSKFKSIFE